MSVLLNTSAGDLVVDLYTESCPIATKNFLKLCQIKYYNNCLFYNVQQNFIAQSGDPTGTGKGGSSIYGVLNGECANYFQDELVKGRKLNKVGMVGMAHSGGKEHTNRSQFFITLRAEDLDQFESSHTIFGEIAEGFDVLEKINGLYCDEEGRPYQDVRILHTYVLDDPFPDPSELQVPPSSPERTYPEEERVKRRLPYSETIEDDADGRTAEELEQSIRRKEAKSRAIVLEMTGDLPDAEVKPPDEVLFVCKLNPVTTDEDLELIFSRFGTIKSCEVIRDFKTGDSLNYAFIEFETAAACIEAYEKMNNVLIDDRRIKVDFSQSVSKLWNRHLLQPRKDSSGGNSHSGASKAGEKPSYYMRQPGMPAAAPGQQSQREGGTVEHPRRGPAVPAAVMPRQVEPTMRSRSQEKGRGGRGGDAYPGSSSYNRSERDQRESRDRGHHERDGDRGRDDRGRGREDRVVDRHDSHRTTERDDRRSDRDYGDRNREVNRDDRRTDRDYDDRNRDRDRDHRDRHWQRDRDGRQNDRKRDRSPPSPRRGHQSYSSSSKSRRD